MYGNIWIIVKIMKFLIVGLILQKRFFCDNFSIFVGEGNDFPEHNKKNKTKTNMKKAIAIVALLTIGLFGFSQNTQEEQVVKLELTATEVNVIFQLLGEAPAKVSEGIRAKIAQQYQAQVKPAPAEKK